MRIDEITAASMRVEYHPAVEAGLKEIRNYYEARSPVLGAQFESRGLRRRPLVVESPGHYHGGTASLSFIVDMA